MLHHPDSGARAATLVHMLHLFLQLLFLLVFLNRRLIVRRGLTLLEADRARRAGRQAVAHAVTVVVSQELRFPIHDADRALMAGTGTDSTAVAFILIDMNKLSYHLVILRFM